MKTIFLKDNMEDFIFQITKETNAGRNVRVSMHGYNAIVYANSSASSIRREIVIKLRTIAQLETNLDLLRSHVSSDVLERYLTNCTPEDVSELCLEEGLIGNRVKSM